LHSSAPYITEEFQRPVVANIKSQLKRIKTNEKARQRNKATKSALKTSIRRFHEAANAGEVAKATELAHTASRALDKAVSKGIIHKNQAANRKSAIGAQAARLETSTKKPRKRARSASAG
jgi:small subunit ribosomal protein S20